MLGVTDNQTHFIIESEIKGYEGEGEFGLHGEKVLFSPRTEYVASYMQ